MPPTYDSWSVCNSVSAKYDDPAVPLIVNQVDGYASSSQVCRGMVRSRGGDHKEYRRAFKRQAARSVKPHAREIARAAYGSVWWLPLAWLVIRPLVMRVIETFIDTLLFESRAGSN